jgi:hypothetical protein
VAKEDPLENAWPRDQKKDFGEIFVVFSEVVYPVIISRILFNPKFYTLGSAF